MKRIISIIMSIVLMISALVLTKTSAEEKNLLDVRLITVADTVSYLVIDASKYNSEIKEVYLDDVKKDFTKVDNGEMIVKREFDGSHSKIKVVLEDRTLDSDISDVYKDFKYGYSGGNPISPDVVIAHATMAVWDYHSIAKDDNGKELVYPQRTTFDVDYNTKKDNNLGDSNQEKPKKVGNLAVDDTMFFKYGGDIELIYDYANSSQKLKYSNARRIYASNVNQNKKLKVIKSKKDNEGILKISASSATKLLKKGENNLVIEYKDKSLEKIKIIYDDSRKHSENSALKASEDSNNPNPLEKPDSRVFDYKKDIVFKYDLNNIDEKNKYENISKIVKVYSDTGQESGLRISKKTINNIGQVKISFNSSRAIQKNGKHTIKIYYKNRKEEIDNIYLKEKSPEVILTADSGEYVTGKSTLFNLKGFSYIFQQDTGIQTVYLNGKKLTRKRVINNDENYEEVKASGEDVAENESENPWHVVGESFRIKNDGIKYLKKGVNYLTIQYDGYHDSNFKFVLNEKKNSSNKPIAKRKIIARNNLGKAIPRPITGFSIFKSKSNFDKVKVDVMASATVGGSSSSPTVGGDGSGSNANMPSKIAFKFDMVANAIILEKLSYNVPSAKKLIDAWEGSSKEIALMNNSINKRVVWDRYLTFVQNNRVNNNEYKSFDEYYNDSSVYLTQNGYYSIKYAFGNGFGAPIYNMRVYENSEEPSKPIKSNNINVDVRFRSEGYSNMMMRVNDEAKFDILDFNAPRVTSVDLYGPNNLRENIGESEYTYYKSLGMLSIKSKYFSESGDYSAVFHFDGANDSSVIFSVGN